MKLRFSLIALFLLLTATAHASTPVAVNEYTSLRRQCLTQLSLDTLKSNAPSYIGKIFELRGTLAGFSKNDTGCNIILNTPDKGSFMINTDSLPCENPGLDLACLVKIGEGSLYNMSDLRLVACTYDSQLRRAEEAAQKAMEEEAARKAAAVEKAKAQAAATATNQAAQSKAAPMNVSSDELIKIYKNAVKGFNKRLSDSQADTIARSILGFSQKYQVDPRLICAVILTESNFNPDATSGAGAQGLGQLMPGTAAGLGVDDAYDPVQSIYGAVRYIKSMIERLAGGKQWSDLTYNDLSLALAGYNAGPGAVKKHGGVPPYRETQKYVKKVISYYKQLCGVK